jgi:hypothetical protein
MKHKILFVTQTLGAKAACGIGLIGKLIGETLMRSQNYEFHMLYTDTQQETALKINELQPRVVIYNYAPGTTPWMDAPGIRDYFSDIIHIRIMHDMFQRLADEYRPEHHAGWQYIIADDPSVTETPHVFITNRLIPDPAQHEYQDTGVPVIGFQGFGPPHKGIARLAHQIQAEFDEAVFRLHIPFGFYEDLIHGRAGSNALARVAEVNSIITKPGIRLEFSHDLWETDQVVEWLAQNTINCYFYDYLDGCGIASSPDYALAARRPIALTKSHQFRNFWNVEPSIFIEDKSIKEIIAQGTAPLEPFYTAYSAASVIADYERILDTLIAKHS